MEVIRYHSGFRQIWNNFNAAAVNGTFLFDRGFIEYHSDRFTDHSLLFFSKGKLLALLPMHEKGKLAASHLGLSFGGVMITGKVNIFLLIQIFEQLVQYLKSQHFTVFIYKAQPYVYLQQPAQDDLFALYHNQAQLCQRTIISVLDLSLPPVYSKLRQRCLKKAREHNLLITVSEEVSAFMILVQEIYAKSGIQPPTHTAAELELLKKAFPENIILLTATNGHELVGGVILFVHRQVVNLQYIATTATGRQLHVLDLLVEYVINKFKIQKKYLSFGSSHDGKGPYGLNQDLLQNKNSYGARGVMQDTYQINLQVKT